MGESLYELSYNNMHKYMNMYMCLLAILTFLLIVMQYVHVHVHVHVRMTCKKKIFQASLLNFVQKVMLTTYMYM